MLIEGSSTKDILLALGQERKQEYFEKFEPYAKQRDFIECHDHAPISYLSAGNGCGKTAVGAYIDVCHLTGEYPEDWKGFKFEKTGVFWIFSTSPKTLINGIQEQLFCAGGFYKIREALNDSLKPWPIEANRGGKMPKRCIVDLDKAPGVSKGNDYIESLTISHKSGGVNQVWFGHYDLGSKKIAAKHNLFYIHWDEIPPHDMFSEGISRQRSTETGVKQIITATPERKADQITIDTVFDEGWEKIGNSRTVITIDDVPDEIISKDAKAQAKLQTPERDKPAKLYGRPVSGAVFFDLQPEEFRISQSEWINLKRRNSYTAINGIDFGFNDDTGFACLYTNTIDGTVVLDHSIKKQYMSPAEFYQAAKLSGFNITLPVAWPHDGERRDKDMTTTKEGKEAKKMVSQFYREAGFKMLPEKVKRFVKESFKHQLFSEIEQVAKQGMFYIVAGNTDFEDEWRNLQIGEDGKVKGKDHIIDAVVCAWLSRKYGKPVSSPVESIPSLWNNSREYNGVSSHLMR